MFTIKAQLPDGTTDIYETGQMTISKDRKALEFHNPMWNQQVEIRVNESCYDAIYIENQFGKTIETLRHYGVRTHEQGN